MLLAVAQNRRLLRALALLSHMMSHVTSHMMSHMISHMMSPDVMGHMTSHISQTLYLKIMTTHTLADRTEVDSQTHQKLFWQEEEEADGDDVCVLSDHNKRLELCSESPNYQINQKAV